MDLNNGYGVYEIGVDLYDTEDLTYSQANKLSEMIFPKGYPVKDVISFNGVDIFVESEFAITDRVNGDSVLIYSFACSANTDSVDKIRSAMEDYVSKRYDGDFEIIVQEAEEGSWEY